MQNIHLLTTNIKTNLLLYKKDYIENTSTPEDNLRFCTDKYVNNEYYDFQHIYVTNHEVVNDGDWYWDENKLRVRKYNAKREAYPSLIHRLKIVLTNNNELIKNKIQSIDDEFLKWFTKNQTIKYVIVSEKFIDKEFNSKYFIKTDKNMSDKNIHLLTTEKHSNIWSNKGRRLYFKQNNPNDIDDEIRYLLCITNDDLIESGNWYVNGLHLYQADRHYQKAENDKKVILINNTNLMIDGVQYIGDEFIEWFIENPNCEYVEILQFHQRGDISGKLCHKIVIPTFENHKTKKYCEKLTCDNKDCNNVCQELKTKPILSGVKHNKPVLGVDFEFSIDDDGMSVEVPIQKNINKPIHAKPSLYAFYFEHIKEIGLKYGYNIVLHGSMNRDLDLIAIPWIKDIGDKDLMVDEISKVLGGYILNQNRSVENPKGERFSLMAHNRLNYIININRDFKIKFEGLVSEIVEFTDPQYYIDLSVIQSNSNRQIFIG